MREVFKRGASLWPGSVTTDRSPYECHWVDPFRSCLSTGPVIELRWPWMVSQYQGCVPVVEEYPRLDIRWLKREGLLSKPHRLTWSDGSLTLVWHKGIEMLLEHWPVTADFTTESRVPLTRTPCYFGGQRLWCLCPGCDRRVAILIAFPSFRCRECHRLSYASSNRSRDWQPDPVAPKTTDRVSEDYALMVQEKLRCEHR